MQYNRYLTTDPRTKGAPRTEKRRGQARTSEDKKTRKITKKNKFTAKAQRTLPGLENAEDEKGRLGLKVKGKKNKLDADIRCG